MLCYISKASKQKLSSLVTCRLLKSYLTLDLLFISPVTLTLKSLTAPQKTQKCTIHSGYKWRDKREYGCRLFMNVQKEKDESFFFPLALGMTGENVSRICWCFLLFLRCHFLPLSSAVPPPSLSLLARAQATAHLDSAAQRHRMLSPCLFTAPAGSVLSAVSGVLGGAVGQVPAEWCGGAGGGGCLSRAGCVSRASCRSRM